MPVVAVTVEPQLYRAYREPQQVAPAWGSTQAAGVMLVAAPAVAAALAAATAASGMSPTADVSEQQRHQPSFLMKHEMMAAQLATIRRGHGLGRANRSTATLTMAASAA